MKLDQIEKIIQLRAQGHTQHHIASVTGFTTRTIIRVLQKYRFEFATREHDVMQKTFEKSAIGHAAQSYFQAGMLIRLEEEFNRRPLSDVPTPMLAKMVIAARKSSQEYEDRKRLRADESMILSETKIDLDEDERPVQEPQQDTRTGSAQFAGTHQPATPAQTTFVPSIVPARPVTQKQTSTKNEPVKTKENTPQPAVSSNHHQPNPNKTNQGNGIPKILPSRPQNTQGHPEPTNPGPSSETPKPRPGLPD